jgi:hypothetical protein
MLGEVVGADEGQNMGLEGIEVWIVEDLDSGVLDGAVHALSLTIGPGVVWLGQPVLDAVLLADTIEDMRSEIHPCRSLPDTQPRSLICNASTD